MRKRTENPTGDLLTVQQAAARLNLGQNTTRKLATESHASRKIGKSVRVDIHTLLQYVEKEFSE